MKIYGKSIRLSQLFFLTIYYGFAQYLPNSYCAFRPLGMASNWIRVYCVKRIFKKCGHIRTINRKVHFASGRNIEIGDESGIGANTSIPGNTIIGNHVILSRNCFILDKNHIFGERIFHLMTKDAILPNKLLLKMIVG